MDEKDKSFTIELFMHLTFDFIMEILKLGKWCKVVESESFKNEVKKVINEMYLMYNKL